MKTLSEVEYLLTVGASFFLSHWVPL